MYIIQEQDLEHLVSIPNNIAKSRLAGVEKYIYRNPRKINNSAGSARS